MTAADWILLWLALSFCNFIGFAAGFRVGRAYSSRPPPEQSDE